MTVVETQPPEPAPEHFEIAKKAAARLGAMAEGNGLTANQVRIAKEDAHVHRLPAEFSVIIKPDISHRIMQGKVSVGQVLGSKKDVHAQAEKTAQEFLSVETVQKEILAEVEKKPGRGFGAEPFNFKINQSKKEYSVVDKCLTCQGSMFSPCLPCQGTGMLNCNTCLGTGQQRNSDGSLSQCMSCGGRRQSQCLTCHGQGKIGCGECAQSGFTTHIYTAEWHAETTFTLDRKLIPEEILKIVDHFGVKQLSIGEHAEISLQQPALRDHHLIITCYAMLPVTAAEFSVVGRNCPALIAGLHGTVLEVEPFLDGYIKPGINALLKLSKGPMAVDALVQTACKYKVIRETLSGLSHHKKAFVYQKIISSYPKIISDKYAKGLVKYADIALLALSEKPRTKGLVTGTLLAAALSALYFMTPLHVQVTAFFEQKGLGARAFAADIVVYILGCIIAIYTIRIMAAGALRKILPSSVTTAKDSGLPSPGGQGALAVLTTLAAFLVPAFMAVQKPAWVLLVLARIGAGQ
jgi:hypothetical protein